MLVTTRELPSAERLAGDMVPHHRDGDTGHEGLGRHRQTSITTPVPPQSLVPGVASSMVKHHIAC